MKKLMLLFLAATLGFAVIAQTVNPTKADAEKDVKKDLKKLKEQRADRNKKIVKGKFKQANEEQKDINKTRKDMKASKKHLKNMGEKAPIEKAKEEMKNEK